MIKGVKVKELKVIPDERGRLMEILRRDDWIFQGFGQIYLTTAYPGVVKAWHYHKKQYDNFTVVSGMMKIALYDEREGSETKGEVNEFFIGEYNQILLQIPPGVWHGFKCISTQEAMVINCCSEPYDHKDPDEIRRPAHDEKVPYNWGREDR